MTMPIPQERIAILLQLYSGRKTSSEEEMELFDWLESNHFQHPFEQHIQLLVEHYNGKEPVPAVDWDVVYNNILMHAGEEIPAPVIQRRLWPKVAVAAAVAVVISAVSVYFLSSTSIKSLPIVRLAPASQSPGDVPPGMNGAVLTLSSGKKILLDSASNGALAKEGSITLVNKDGRLVYDRQNLSEQQEISYNTMTTAKGRQYQLQLADGSRVWLNAASSITYPTTFAGKERRVTITGEAYFEIAHDASKPFKVTANGMDIQVLGTHFNVNLYDDEALTRTTLIEGSVKLTKNNASVVLTPGQQAQVNNKGEIKLTNDVSIDEVIAWKNGFFIMKKADIGSIMRQVARWYDISVVYQDGIPAGRISGDISRSMNLSKLMEVFELSGIHLAIDDKKVIVKP
ncbi:MAG: FecR domain-containing protein [Flavitalea sp.]